MAFLFNVLTLAFDILLAPFRSLPPAWGIGAVSLLTAVFILLVYRFVSNQKAIQREKKRIQGHFLGIYLFQNSAREIFRSLLRLLLAIVRYLGWSLPPLLIVIVPVLLACVQLDLRYGRRGLEPGERANVGVRWPDHSEIDRNAALQSPPGLTVETPPLKIGWSIRETEWRVRVEQAGIYELTLAAGDVSAGKELVAQSGIRRIYPETGEPRWLSYLLFPGDAYLPVNAPFSRIFIDYPARRINVLGWQLHWAVVYFVLAVLFGFLLKRPLKVEF